MSLTIQKAITELESLIGVYDDIYDYEAKELWPVFELAVAALREKEERENPQPLTLEELRQLKAGEVIYHNSLQGMSNNWVVLRQHDIDIFKTELTAVRYGKTWIGYRHKPKEAET